MPHCGIIYQHLHQQKHCLRRHPSFVWPTCIGRGRRRSSHQPDILNVQIRQEAIPEDFLQADLQVGKWRHLIFYMTTLLSLLCQGMVRRWHLQSCWRSFYSIVDNPCIPCVKQVPLVFALMSRKATYDYVSVLRHMVNHFLFANKTCVGDIFTTVMLIIITEHCRFDFIYLL